jgi:hypothetical protein
MRPVERSTVQLNGMAERGWCEESERDTPVRWSSALILVREPWCANLGDGPVRDGPCADLAC